MNNLEQNLPGIGQKLTTFIDELADRGVSPDFGTDCMTLRWRPENGKSWNLGSITSKGLVWFDFLGRQAQNAGLLETRDQYLDNLAAGVPNALVKRYSKVASTSVATPQNNYIRIDELLANDERAQGWLRAIEEFQTGVTKFSSAD